jgi:hypothetical protein
MRWIGSHSIRIEPHPSIFASGSLSISPFSYIVISSKELPLLLVPIFPKWIRNQVSFVISWTGSFFSLLLCLCLSLSRTTRVFLTNLTTPCPHPQVDHAPSSPAFPFAPPFHIINLLLRPREPLASLESAIGPGQLAKHIVTSSSWSCVLVFRCRRCRLLSSTRLLSAFDIQNHLGFASSQRR